ncbi:MAG TPA: hypothetical protein VIJ75_00455 [Hanamia sp.]
MENEIPFQYEGNPPEFFKKVLSLKVKEIMSDIKKEVLENKGFLFLNYINDADIEIKAACNNPETLMKMTIKLQGIISKKIRLN